LYTSSIIITIIEPRRMRLAGHVEHLGGKMNLHRILAGNLEGNRPLGRSRRRWEDNIKIYLSEIGWGGMDWIDLTQDRDQLRDQPSGSITC
jgi:hypothetical protein